MKCDECGGTMTTEPRAVRRYDMGGLPHVELHGLEVSRCASCGIEDVTIPRIEQLHRVLASSFISQTRALIPAEIRFLRKHIGLSTIAFAKCMGKARETVSRWETGKAAMGPSADRLLRLLVATSSPVKSYAAVQVLTDITEPAPKRPHRFGVRVSRDGWRPDRKLASV